MECLKQIFNIIYGFAEVSKNLAKYRSENNFVGLSKQLRRTLKHA